MKTLLSFISDKYTNIKASAYFSVLARNQPFLLSILTGVIAFVAITGGRILRPGYIDWLMEEIDAGTNYLGWQFFRHTPIFQYPLGAIPSFGTDMGNTVVHTDSIILFAFLFKPFSSILPNTFQFVGLWILCCFVLQAYFAYKLLAYFTKDKWLLWIGSGFFVLAPPCIFRLVGHYSLFGQWVLLAGFCLYFSSRFTLWRWIVLLSVTALLHGYLLVMVGAIWVADLLQRSWRRELKIAQALFCFLAGVGVTGAVMWQAGYFMPGRRVVYEGFGVYRLNLLSLINPDRLGSVILPDQPVGPGEYEGFNYLGLGMLALALIAGYKWLRKPKMSIDRRSLVPLLLISLGLCLYAISNRVAIGSQELFAYPLPYLLDRVANTFRASGRMFWPVFYLIYLVVLCLVFRRLKRHVAITVCSLMLVVQFVDSSASHGRFRKKLSHAPKWSSPLRSSLWADIGKQYKRIVYVLPRFAPDNFLAWGQFAGEYRMTINSGYFARPDPLKFDEAGKRVTQSITENKIDPDALYVFEHEGLWKAAFDRAAKSDLVGVLDGFRILAPKLRDCVACDRAAMTEVRVEEAHIYPIGERVLFAQDGTSFKYAGSGWSFAEPWGKWTEGSNSFVTLKLSNIPDRDMALSIEGHAFLTDKHPVQDIEVLVNQHSVETLRYTLPASLDTRVITIPKSLTQEKKGLLLIEFKIKNPKSPADLGLSPDSRRLGLGLVSLRLDGLKDCVNCDRAAMTEVRVEEAQVYPIGERISFAQGGTSLKYAGSGWSGAEPWGTWTEGSNSVVTLKLSDIPDRDMTLSIEGNAFLTDKHPVQEIEALVNRHPVKTLRYTLPASVDTRVITIPKSLIQEKKGLLLIEFKIKNPKSPADLGLSTDSRRLGLGLVSLRLDETKR